MHRIQSTSDRGYSLSQSGESQRRVCVYTGNGSSKSKREEIMGDLHLIEMAEHIAFLFRFRNEDLWVSRRETKSALVRFVIALGIPRRLNLFDLVCFVGCERAPFR